MKVRGRLRRIAWWLVLGVGAWRPVAGQAGGGTTAVTDTLRLAGGAVAQGMVLLEWPSFVTASGVTVPKGSTSVALGAGGALSVALGPNAGATPAGTFYTAVFHLNDGTVTREYWTVPVSATAVHLSAVRAQVLPTSVAVQTVSKQYVDQAIARVAAGSVDTTTLVAKTGATMTGPLVLAGDPAEALQAASKSYVDTAVTTGVGAALTAFGSSLAASARTDTTNAANITSGTLPVAQSAALSGDCTKAAGSGTVLCTKTNGVAFAPSATTDATNASNITSGTLPVAQSAALTGDCAKAAGSGAVVCTRTNGAAFGTMATQNAAAVAVTGGALDGVAIGSTTPASTVVAQTLGQATASSTPTYLYGALRLRPAANATATAALNQPSRGLQLFASVWNGTAAADDSCSLMNTPGAGTNPAMTLSVNCTASASSRSFAVPYETDVLQLVLTGSAPTIATGAGAGSGATATVSGSNMAGAITLTAGSSPAANSTVLSLTFTGTVQSAPKGCTVMARTAQAAAAASAVYAAAPTAIGWSLLGNAAALTAGGSYGWSYACL